MIPDCYLEFSVSELLMDPLQIREALLAACRRHAPARLTTICQTEESFLVVCQSARNGLKQTADIQIDTLVLATKETLLAKMKERWNGGYDVLGCISDTAEDGSIRRFLFTQK